MKFPSILAAALFATTLFGTGNTPLTASGAAPTEPDAPAAVAAKHAAALRADVKNFQLQLSYRGQSDKPYYNLLLSVQKVPVLQADAFFLSAQITEAEALGLIAHLETSGLLARAVDAKTTKLQEQQPSYRLTATAGETQLITNLGWSLETLKHLDDLRKLVDGEAAKRLDTLLARLSGHRREWAAAKK